MRLSKILNTRLFFSSIQNSTGQPILVVLLERVFRMEQALLVQDTIVFALFSVFYYSYLH